MIVVSMLSVIFLGCQIQTVLGLPFENLTSLSGSIYRMYRMRPAGNASEAEEMCQSEGGLGLALHGWQQPNTTLNMYRRYVDFLSINLDPLVQSDPEFKEKTWISRNPELWMDNDISSQRLDPMDDQTNETEKYLKIGFCIEKQGQYLTSNQNKVCPRGFNLGLMGDRCYKHGGGRVANASMSNKICEDMGSILVQLETPARFYDVASAVGDQHPLAFEETFFVGGRRKFGGNYLWDGSGNDVTGEIKYSGLALYTRLSTSRSLQHGPASFFSFNAAFFLLERHFACQTEPTEAATTEPTTTQPTTTQPTTTQPTTTQPTTTQPTTTQPTTTQPTTTQPTTTQPTTTQLTTGLGLTESNGTQTTNRPPPNTTTVQQLTTTPKTTKDDKEIKPLPPKLKTAATVIQSMGCTWLIIMLTAELIISMLSRDFTYKRALQVGEEASLLIAHIGILLLTDSVGDEILCQVASGALHYFFMVHASFLAFDSAHCYGYLTGVLLRGGWCRLSVAFLALCGSPAVVVAVAFALLRQNYPSPYTCWVNYSSMIGAIITSPMAILFSITIILTEASFQEKRKAMPLVPKKVILSNRMNSYFLIPITMVSFAHWQLGSIALHHQMFSMYIIMFGLNITLGILFILRALATSTKVNFQFCWCYFNDFFISDFGQQLGIPTSGWDEDMVGEKSS